MSNQHSFNATVSSAKTFVINLVNTYSFTTTLNNIHTFVTTLTSGSSVSPVFGSFSSANFIHYFSGFITDIITTMNARANILIHGARIIVTKTLLTITPKVEIFGGLNIFTSVLRQFIRMVQIDITVAEPILNVTLRERIKPEGTNILVYGADIDAIPLVRQYNYIYNVSGCTIDQVKNLTLNEFTYTVI